jgi:DNA (cytosine-5)-methyltransferase 1
MRELNAISVFSGSGGADLGFEQAGFSILYAIDTNPDCIETYNYNSGGICRPYSIAYLNRNIDMVKKSIGYKDLDVIFGGPPCQSFSLLRAKNKLKGEGLENVYQMQRFVEAMRPKVFVCENVEMLFKLCMFPIRAEFEKFKGYKVKAFNLNAEDFGVPQSRKRAFFIGIRDDLPLTLKSFKEDHWSKSYNGWLDYLNSKLGYERDRVGVYLKRSSDVAGRLHNEAAFTITGAERPCIRSASGSLSKGIQVNSFMRQVCGIEQRYLRIDEIQCLQGFPKDYEFFGNVVSVRQQIGNAWCVPVGRAIAEAIKETLV